MKFEDIIKIFPAAIELKRAVESDKIFHAYIFAGYEDIIKKKLTDIFSQAMVCTDVHIKPCGICPSCGYFLAGTHPDYRIITPLKNTIGVDQIRDIIADASVKPYISRYKVYVIENAQTMTVQAQNALLKTLEDPPPNNVMVILVDKVSSLLPTVVSRCRVYNVGSVSETKVKQKKGYSDESRLRDEAIDVFIKLVDGKWKEFFPVEDFFMGHKEDIETVLDIISNYVRDIVIYRQAGETSIVDYSGKEIQKYAVGFTLAQLSSVLDSLDEAKKNLVSNANYQLAIDVMLIRILEVIDNDNSSRNTF